MDTAIATDTDLTSEQIATTLRSLKGTLGMIRTPGMGAVVTLTRLGMAYERAQTEQDAGMMKHNREAEAMGRGRTEGLRLAVAILLECDEATATAVLDGMDTRE